MVESAKKYLIASEKEFDQQQPSLLEIGFDNTIRSAPVFTDEACSKLSSGETGCFRAHIDVWKKCAAQNDHDHCIVLERDWTIGDQNPSDVYAVLSKELSRVQADNKDVYYMGECKFVYDDTSIHHTKLAKHLCTHAYMISKDFAKQIAETSACDINMPIDHFLNKKCHHPDISCEAAQATGTMPGCFGTGPIQQDRMNYKGMHGITNQLHKKGTYDH